MNTKRSQISEIPWAINSFHSRFIRRISVSMETTQRRNQTPFTCVGPESFTKIWDGFPSLIPIPTRILIIIIITKPTLIPRMFMENSISCLLRNPIFSFKMRGRPHHETFFQCLSSCRRWALVSLGREELLPSFEVRSSRFHGLMFNVVSVSSSVWSGSWPSSPTVLSVTANDTKEDDHYYPVPHSMEYVVFNRDWYSLDLPRNIRRTWSEGARGWGE